jgi:membrane protease YdiL (CAAX protease family)
MVAGYAWWRLSRDPDFDMRGLWNPLPLAAHFRTILSIFILVALLIWIGVRWLSPQLEWNFVRERPVLWAVVMVLYPVLSVYPQALLYRAFFMHEFASLFPDRWTLLVASAAAFGFLHIIFRNPLAVTLTFFGGVLFAWRYQQTSSLFTSSFEHALYGCWLFTIGLGQYFYHGALPRSR